MVTYITLPNGSKVPYILDIIPHVQVGDIAPQLNFETALRRWPETFSKPHFVVDSAFGSIEMVTKVLTWGGQCTIACAPGVEQWLWETLSLHLPGKTWRTAVHTGTEIVASIRINAECSTYQRVLSTGWETDIKTCTTPRSETNIQSRLPRFTADSLQNMTVTELKQICDSYNIRKGKRKADYVENILLRVSTEYRNTDIASFVAKELETFYFSVTPPVHTLYRDHFNLVDLHDKRWYSVEETHPIHRWQTKHVLGILRNSMGNIWVKHFLEDPVEWLDFRKDLALELFSL